MLALNRGRPEQMGLREMLDGLRRLPRGGRRPPHQVRADQGPRPRPRAGRPGHRRRQHRRGHPHHPLVARTRPRRASAWWPRLAGRRHDAADRADRRPAHASCVDGDRVRLTDEQARAILALTLSRLTGLGRDEIFGEAREPGRAPSRLPRDPRLARADHGHRPRGTGRGPRRLRRAAPHRRSSTATPTSRTRT